MVDLRLDVASRFIRRLRGQPSTFSRGPATDAAAASAGSFSFFTPSTFTSRAAARATSPRKCSRSDQAQLPSVEWKDSHARRTANRLIHDSIALVERGYLKLLRGG